MWRRGEHVQSIARAYGIQFTPSYIGGPLQEAREQGREVRYRLDKITDKHHILLQELKSDGGTDYLAVPMRISRKVRCQSSASPPIVRKASATPTLKTWPVWST